MNGKPTLLTLCMSACVLYVCHAAVDGGALYGGDSAHLSVHDSTFLANTASFGGAIVLYFTAQGVFADGERFNSCVKLVNARRQCAPPALPTTCKKAACCFVMRHHPK